MNILRQFNELQKMTMESFSKSETSKMSDYELADIYDTHDCHNSPEDGCQVCQEYFNRFEGDYQTKEEIIDDKIRDDVKDLK